jgi:DNA-directed RNA polymerase subunit alpha
MNGQIQRDNFFSSSFDLFLKEKIEKIASFTISKTEREEEIIKDGSLSKFFFSPLGPGMGTSIGNMLRRTMLSSIDGYAISAVKIYGVSHIFDKIKGVREDVVDIILNLKQVVIKCTLPKNEESSCELILVADHIGEIYAENIICPEGFEIASPKQFICYVEQGARFRANLLVVKGTGYVTSEDYSKSYGDELISYESGESCILVDSIFNPVIRVSFTTHLARESHRMDCESLSLEIETNGAITPRIALQKGFEILLRNTALLSETPDILNDMYGINNNGVQELPFDKIMFDKIDTLNLPVRASRGLSNLKVEYIGDLVTKTFAEILSINSIGEKSIKSIKTALSDRSLSLEMKLDGWPLQETDIIHARLKKESGFLKTHQKETEFSE